MASSKASPADVLVLGTASVLRDLRVNLSVLVESTSRTLPALVSPTLPQVTPMQISAG
jgi:hypothetical protein